MRVLEQFVEAPLAGTLGWALLHSLWQGAIVAAILAAVLLVFRSPRIRYFAACSAMLALAVGFVTTLGVVAPTQAQRSLNATANSFRPWNFLADQNNFVSWRPELGAIAPWLGPLWMIGVCAFCLLRLAGWISARKLRSRGVCGVSEFWRNKLAELSARMRVSRPVQLLESCLVDVPLALGHLRPVILIPIGMLSALPVAQVEAILMHELAHIRRHDYLLNAAQRLIESFFFYHPATWWISSVIRNEREHCCDDVVVAMTGNAQEYAVVLAALERSRISSLELALAATGGRLMKRIHRLLNPTQSVNALAPALAVAILLATAATSMAALRWDSAKQSSTPAKIAAEAAARQSAPLAKVAAEAAATQSAAYAKWIDEDVVYIIDDAERAAFVSLSSDAERDQFIEQFWERRNPTPGSAQNAFKEEHYHRIAYANAHFQTASGGAGWRTDRGHMYIVFGPPDEIEAHAAKSQQKPLATETWMYRHVEGVGENGIFTFVDRTGHGDFNLAPANARF